MEYVIRDDMISFTDRHITKNNTESTNISPFELNSYQNICIMADKLHKWYDDYNFNINTEVHCTTNY